MNNLGHKREKKKPLTTHHKLKCFNNLSIPLLMGFGQFLKHVALLVPSPFKLNKHESSCDLCPLEKIDYLIYFLNTSKSIPQKIYAKKKKINFLHFLSFPSQVFPKWWVEKNNKRNKNWVKISRAHQQLTHLFSATFAIIYHHHFSPSYSFFALHFTLNNIVVISMWKRFHHLLQVWGRFLDDLPRAAWRAWFHLDKDHFDNINHSNNVIHLFNPQLLPLHPLKNLHWFSANDAYRGLKLIRHLHHGEFNCFMIDTILF